MTQENDPSRPLACPAAVADAVTTVTTVTTRRRRARRRPGFTLVETIVATVLLSAVVVGTAALFVGAGKTAVKVRAGSQVVDDAAIAMQRVTDDLREAYAVELPDGSVGLPWTMGSPASYTSPKGFTGAVIYAPPKESVRIAVAGAAGAAQSVDLMDRSIEEAKKIPLAFYYRGDADGAPSPNGKFLLRKTPPFASSRPQVILNNLIEDDTLALRFQRSGERLMQVKVATLEETVNGNWVSSDNVGGKKAGDKVNDLDGRVVWMRNSQKTNPTFKNKPSPPPLGVLPPSPTPYPVYTPTPVPTPRPPTPPPTPTPYSPPTPTPKPPTPTPYTPPTPTPPTPTPGVGLG